jgi:hypothetical protein
MRSLTRAASVAGVCLLLALTGCTLHNPRTGAPVANPIDNAAPANSWVGTEPDGSVLLVQFSRAGQTIQGTLDFSSFSTDRTQVESTHAGFTGVIEGTNITLTFAEGLGFATAVSGSIDSATLALNFPDSTSGGLATVSLTPGGLDKYNAGVASIKAKAAANAQARAQAQAQAAADAKRAEAADVVNNDMSKLQKVLDNGVSFTALDNDLATANRDLATTQADAQKAISEGRGSFDGCYDAHSAQYDAGTVKYDLDSLTFDENFYVTEIIDQVNRLIATLQQDFANFGAVYASQNPSVYASDADAVNALVSKARAAVNTWGSKLPPYTSQAQQYLDQANAAAAAAVKAVC